MLLVLFAVVVVVFVVLPFVGVALWALLSTALVGLFIGALGRLIVPGTQPIGCLATVVAGLAGSIAGTVIGHAIHAAHLATILLEIGVAAVLVALMSRARPRLGGPAPPRSLYP